jgi:MYST family zinc finger domain
VTRSSGKVCLEKSALFENPIEKMLENEHNERTKIKYIERITIGKDLTLDTWYASPYPMEYEKVRHLYIC